MRISSHSACVGTRFQAFFSSLYIAFLLKSCNQAYFHSTISNMSFCGLTLSLTQSFVVTNLHLVSLKLFSSQGIFLNNLNMLCFKMPKDVISGNGSLPESTLNSSVSNSGIFICSIQLSISEIARLEASVLDTPVSLTISLVRRFILSATTLASQTRVSFSSSCLARTHSNCILEVCWLFNANSSFSTGFCMVKRYLENNQTYINAYTVILQISANP